MAKRVLQADGTYCYTENCRVHERGGLPAVGAASLVADAGRATRKEAAGAIETALVEHKSLYKTKKALNEAAEQITDTLYNANNMSPFAIANLARAALSGEDKGFNDTYDWDRMVELSSHILEGAKAAHRIEQGTRVVIAETGETGTISETHNLLAPKPYRVHVDNFGSRNDFKFFPRTAVVKIAEPELNAPVREWVAYARPDELLEPNSAAKLLRQETDPATYNAQGLRGIAKPEQARVREEFEEIAAKLDRANGNLTNVKLGVTKGSITRVLKDEFAASRPWLNTQERENVRDALANILAYTDAGVKLPRLTEPVPVSV